MKRISKIFIILGILFISVSGYMLASNIYIEDKAGKLAIEVLEEVENKIEDNFQNDGENIIKNNPDVKKSISFNGYDYFGTITIPALNIKLPIMNKFDYERLNIAPCVYYGSLETNNLVICGHSYKRHFKYLSNLKTKDNIIIKDSNGSEYLYEVEVIEVLKKTDISLMLESKFDLTLFTCTNGGIDRLAIRCNRIN